MNSRFRQILVGLFFGFMILYAGVNAFQTLRFNRSSPRWQARPFGHRLLVQRASPSVPAAAFPRDRDEGGSAAGFPHEGDEIVSFNGQLITNVPPSRISGLPPGTQYNLIVRRDGRDLQLNLQTGPLPFSVWLTLFALTVVLPLFGLLTGIAVFFLRPDHKHALVLSLLLVNFIPPIAFHWFDGLPSLLTYVMYAGPLITPLAFILILHLFLIFPKPLAIVRRWPFVEWLIYLPYPFLFLVRNIVSGSAWGITQGSLLDKLALVTINLNFAGAVLALFVNYRQSDQAARRRLRVILAGMVLGLVPGMFVFFTLQLFDLSRIDPRIGAWLPVIGALALPLMPLAFAYAIVRHQVIPVSLIVRRSVQYILAKNALRAIMLLPVLHLTYLIASQRQRTIGQIVFNNTVGFYFVVISAAAAVLVFRTRIGAWIDRRFFRESYNQEKILRELIDDVKRLDSLPEMSRRVSEQVERALHPEHVYVFYREEERRDLSLGYSSGGSQSELRIPEEFQLLKFVEYQGSALDFPFPQKTNLPATEKSWLAALGTNLIVPMTGTDSRLAGLFLLGEKKSQVPYTAGDRNLLETLADQVAIVYENVRLKERVDKDRRIKHEVLARVEQRDINLLKECPTCGACFDSSAHVCEHDGRELTLTLPIERTIEQRYRLDKLIGRGGMGAVYQASDLRLNRKVAVKVLSGQLFGNSEALRRFEREAQTSARLSHPNIITVYDYGVLSTEGAYLVMELVQGETLGNILKREKYLAPAVAADCFDQVLAGVGVAHNAGVIHRDLKPENIFTISTHLRRIFKVLDFGLAKIAQPDIDSKSSADMNPMTTPGAVLGTFGYMAPEQLMGGKVDARSDLFSIGVMVVEALTGRRPFEGKTYHELLASIVQKPFHLTGDSPEVSRLDQVLQKCLAKDASERFSSAAELQQQLIPAISNCPAMSLRLSTEPDAETVIFNR